MLTFDNLSLAQKRFIVSLIERIPTAGETGETTLKECGQVYDDLRSERQGKRGEKIGYPNWLFKANKVSRGVYSVPVPTAEQLSDYAKELAAKQTSGATKAKAKVVSLATKVASDATVKKAAKTALMDTMQPNFEDEFNDILKEAGIEL